MTMAGVNKSQDRGGTFADSDRLETPTRVHHLKAATAFIMRVATHNKKKPASVKLGGRERESVAHGVLRVIYYMSTSVPSNIY